MNYKLAKQLKDAGFPQEGKWNYGAETIRNPNADETKRRKVSAMEWEKEIDECFIPTLSELIEACGDRFYSLVFAMENDWRCFSERDGDFIDTADGKTPEEAVAKLWLALNKKETPEAEEVL